MSALRIRDAGTGDAAAITEIYNHYILESVATFEESPLAPEALARRIKDTHSVELPWLIAANESRITGYAYASKWKGRCAYRYSVETTVYVASEMHGQGIGTRVYGELLERLRERGLHAAMGGIALPNDASVALHERLGFVKVAHFPEVGYKFGRWIDVGYWQIRLT